MFGGAYFNGGGYSVADGGPIPVGSSSATVAAGATVTVPVCAMVRAGCDGKDLSLALSGASGTVQNVSPVVTRAA